MVLTSGNNAHFQNLFNYHVRHARIPNDFIFKLVGSRILYFSRCDVLANRRYYGLYQAPCKDTCKEEEDELSAVFEEIKEGRRIKEEYLGGQPDDSPHMASGHLALNVTDLQ